MPVRLKIFVFVILLSLIVSVPTFVYARDVIDNDDLRNLGGNIKEHERNFKTRHDYKLTFKKPYYYNHTVPFFDTYGHALLAPDFIRLAPSVPNHAGSIWAQLPNPHKEWEIELSFRITGNFYVGGRGMALWYTKNRAGEGPVFGNKDKWDGLAIMFETFDHSRKDKTPSIMAYHNDGTKIYTNISEPNDMMLAGCYRFFRNTQSPVYARISYYNSTIMLAIDPERGGSLYYPCFEKNIYLPTGYYFGISAAAEGEAPDDHDILSFETYEINPPDKQNRPLRPHEAEKVKKDSAENYEIPEDVKKRIEDIKKVVSSPKEDSRDKKDFRDIDFIRGMQTRILESLGRLHEIIQTPGGVNYNDKYYAGVTSRTENQLAVISQKLDKVIAGISSLESRVLRLSGGSNDYAVKDLKDNIQRIMGRIDAMDSRIAGQFYQTQRSFQEVNKSREKEATTNIWSYILYFILLGFVVVLFFVLYQTKKEMNQKKFI